jgi:hypothetical protein
MKPNDEKEGGTMMLERRPGFVAVTSTTCPLHGRPGNMSIWSFGLNPQT